MKKLAIAMLCHAANMAYCASIGDNSQVPWDQAPDWQKDSAVKGVEFCQANPDAPASANHDSWMAEKVAAGWVYGDKKDPDAKPPTHPCIMPFDQLPPQQQFKDVLFKTIVAGCPADDANEATIADLTAQVKTLNDEINLHEEEGASNDDQLGKLEQQRTQDAQTIDDLKQKLADSEKDRQAAEDRAADLAKSSAATVARASTSSGKPRKLGEADSKLTGDGLTAALADADKADKKVEIAFSDGKSEIPGVPAIVVTGDVWKDHRLGKMLRDPVEVVGSPPGGSSYQIAGYALLIDGKQVAYCKRSDPISIAPGMKISLADDIVFS